MRIRESLTPNMTPLIDVVFILLIFFIVTSVFKKEELALMLNLPDSQAQKLEVEKENISIELTRDAIAFHGKETTLEILTSNLEQVVKKKTPIIVRIDEDVPYKQIVSILNVLQKNDLHNLALVTKKAP